MGFLLFVWGILCISTIDLDLVWALLPGEPYIWYILLHLASIWLTKPAPSPTSGDELANQTRGRVARLEPRRRCVQRTWAEWSGSSMAKNLSPHLVPGKAGPGGKYTRLLLGRFDLPFRSPAYAQMNYDTSWPLSNMGIGNRHSKILCGSAHWRKFDKSLKYFKCAFTRSQRFFKRGEGAQKKHWKYMCL